MDGRTGLVVVCPGRRRRLGAARSRAARRSRPPPASAPRPLRRSRHARSARAGEAARRRHRAGRPRRRRTSARPKRCSTSLCGATSRSSVRASVTALASLGDRHDWAIDGLVEALAEASENPVRVAGELDRLAPRPRPAAAAAPRPSEPRRPRRTPFACSRAIQRSPSSTSLPDVGSRRRTSAAPRSRRSRPAGSGAALRHALRLLDDPHPQRPGAGMPHGCGDRRPCIAAPTSSRSSADTSWWVREAAREALVAAGDMRRLGPGRAGARRASDTALRSGAALVLQDIGHVDCSVGDDEVGQLERIYGAGGRRLRGAAAERARRGFVLGDRRRALEAGRLVTLRDRCSEPRC